MTANIINKSVPDSFSGRVQEVENSIPSLNRNNFYKDSEIEEIVDLFARDVRAFERKARLYAAQVVVNSLARRNASSVQIFYDRIHICGEIGKQICKDLQAAMRTACQESGKHEVMGRSFFLVRKDKETKKTVFSFKSDIKNTIWTKCLSWAKANRASLLYCRLDAPKSSKTQTYLDRLVAIATTYDKARARSIEGRESSSESERLEAFNRQLERLPDAVKEQVKDAIRILSSLEIPS